MEKSIKRKKKTWEPTFPEMPKSSNSSFSCAAASASAAFRRRVGAWKLGDHIGGSLEDVYQQKKCIIVYIELNI